MSKKLLFLALAIMFCTSVNAQLIELFVETFETPSGTFALNDTGGINPASGNNQWIINNEYDGAPTYCNTISQDSTVSGTIFGAPGSTYLHVYDNGSLPISNCNFDVDNVSDNMAIIKDGFCTLGMVNVEFTFFWLGQGNPNSWGEIYYSRDGGPWVATGSPMYQNQDHWKYEVITDPGFDRCKSLRIGFRWKNGSGGGASCSSFAIDDIIAVGELDTTSPPSITINNVFPDPVCKLEFLIFQYHLSEPLCDNQYRIEVSNSSGVFGTSAGGYVLTIPAGDTVGYTGIPIDGTIPDGPCYKIRLVQLNAPYIVSNASPCIQVITCPNSITTMSAAVMNDADTTCVQSAIDVKFQSFFVFNPGNVYIAQLIDSNTGRIDTIGTLPSSTTYNPSQPPFLPSGTVSGLIPDVPPGCNYYIRVISTNPAVAGNVIGPFCLKQCDVTTNNTIDLKFCIWDTIGGGACDSIHIETESYDSTTVYYAGNSFHLQLRSMLDFSLVFDGNLFIVFDTTSNTWVICMPNSDSLISVFGIAPKTYYGRIVADSTDADHGLNGTVIRVSIGAPASSPPIITPSDTVICSGVVYYFFNPINLESHYEWSSATINFGVPFEWPSVPPLNYLGVDYSGAGPGIYSIRIQEINNGCYGPYSDDAHIYVITEPNIPITGPSDICMGDTVCFYVPFLQETYYNWTISDTNGHVVDQSNNEACYVWDTSGDYTIHIFALNECGSKDSSFSVHVRSVLNLYPVADPNICKGDTVQLYAQTDGLTYDYQTEFSGSLSANGNMFAIVAQNDIQINRFSLHFPNTSPANFKIYTRTGSFVGNETNPFAWNLIYNSTAFVPSGAGVPSEIPFDFYLNVLAGDTQSFYIVRSDGGNLRFSSTSIPIENQYSADANIKFLVGIQDVYEFGAFPPIGRIWNGIINYTTNDGLVHHWSNGSLSDTITVAPDSTTIYSIRISDTSGCGNRTAITVHVNPQPSVNAGSDTLICIKDKLHLNATATDANTFLWSPAESLDNPNILNPLADPPVSVVYIIHAWDAASGCEIYDSVKVDVQNCEDPILVPNVFSPNGDGQNDYFTVFGTGIAEYEIWIYNRWGEEVYHSTDVTELNNLGKGWNGVYKSKMQEIGTYVYYIKATDVRANFIERKGNLTLLK